MTPTNNELLTVEEAARALTISTRTIAKLLQRGELVRVHLGRSVRIPRSSLELYLQRHTTVACPAPRPAL